MGVIARTEAERAVDAFRDYIATHLIPKPHVAGFKLIAKVLGDAAASDRGAVGALERIAASPVNIVTGEGDQAGRRMQEIARGELDRLGGD